MSDIVYDPTRGFSWALTMRWSDLLFAHWPMDPDLVQAALPKTSPPLELDLWEGSAWLGIVPFRMSGIRWRWLPPVPGTDAFPELNVRTYVRVNGRPGVWFFSLDASSKLAVRAARATFNLPYFDADISVESLTPGPWTRYQSRRTHRGGGEAELEVTYAPQGDRFEAAPGTLERWLTERYRLFAADRNGRVRRGEIQHVPWPLQRATARFGTLNMTRWLGWDLPDQPPHLLYARELSVKAARLVAA